MSIDRHDKNLIADICLNQDDAAFSASDVVDQISHDYGLEFTLDDVGEVILDLYACGMLEPERCDRTIDLFNEVPDAKKPLGLAAFL